MGLRVEPLGRRHRTLLKGFQNQHASLVEYLQRDALRHLEKDLLARTYVAIDEGQEGLRLAGYFSLSTVSVERGAGFPIPGVLLARLAVDQRVQGQGLGRFLFEEALGLTLQLAQSGPVAFRLFFTDATEEQAACFYEQFGFTRLADEYPCRMVLDLLPLLTTANTT
ncbi:GNAT family N-acetyltransferase [Archangium gephyra]|uniref:GNAT family N-acetyltransferase n=1 Tax=Archangium gephyra TaxID=48 RepID=UPI003B79BBAF